MSAREDDPPVEHGPVDLDRCGVVEVDTDSRSPSSTHRSAALPGSTDPFRSSAKSWRAVYEDADSDTKGLRFREG
ncbi:hypothetical protein ACIOHS_01670 [Streptomyces sp. NPDC088253]|uniref:hypothetical protein n=1 Tax=Streptomyces sp. NPDC088253 TaxID=3365846 RepID=UPI0038074739